MYLQLLCKNEYLKTKCSVAGLRVNVGRHFLIFMIFLHLLSLDFEYLFINLSVWRSGRGAQDIKRNIRMNCIGRYIIMAACALPAAVPAAAQQTVFGAPVTASPIVRGDSVTFFLDAPQASAVDVTGDFNSPLSKGADGSWTVTLAVPKRDLFLYNYVVDGVRVTDPANPYVMRDIASLFSFFVTEGTPYLAGDTPRGSLIREWYPSPSLGADRRMTVYLPAGYGADDTRRYPVLYLLHGMGGDETAWSDLGRASYILDNMIASGKVNPMIVVMPNGNATQTAAPGETSEGLYATKGSRSVSPKDAFEKSFVDIVAFVDRRYRTLPDAAHRAVAGLSMGGGHTWRIQQLMPGMADYYGIFSGAVGWKGDPARMTEKDSLLPASPRPSLYWIAIGKDDFLYGLNSEFRKELDKAGVDYVYHESDGGHTWSNWRDYLVRFLPLLFR